MTAKVSMEPIEFDMAGDIKSWVADQLAEARREERERCAKVCDERMAYFNRGAAEQYEAENCAAAIRALKD